MELTFPQNAVVVVAGVPGAGKSTLIRRAVDRDGVAVVDTDDARARGRDGRGLYVRHYLRIAGAVLGGRPAVIHTRGTRAPARWAIRAMAFLRARPAHLVLIDAPREIAEAGQRDRGRAVSQTTMDAEWRRWRRLLTHGIGGERWRTVEILDRDEAATVTAFAFAPAAAAAFAAA
ncbi:ATP-binding protein [Svornostia abyssi]|uniref:ATP-binding protein n=1 Tax=Svornostia abyssi TaxID=2898438 RepID=A0ABY5PK34_9ACTN|nr:ATP-binding protein [Parviterribacteraceae bacterium J379]